MSPPQKAADPKIAVITGGKGDLAQAIASELKREGWTVHAPGRSLLDVTDAGRVQAWFDALGRIDLLVNNAGIIRDMPVIKMTGDDFGAVIDVCLKGAFLCSHAAIRKMAKQRSGHIVQIGSFSAISGPAGQVNYASAKAGLIGLTQSLAKEYGKRNLRINCVLPGFLETKMTADLLNNPEKRERILSDHSLGRLNTVGDAARFIAFLDSLTHVSGQVFQLDSRARG